MESELVRADLYDAAEFPSLVRAHNIRSVPKTLINGAYSIEGAVPGKQLIDAILRTSAPQEAIVQHQMQSGESVREEIGGRQ
jgi:hypothetical protein